MFRAQAMAGESERSERLLLGDLVVDRGRRQVRRGDQLLDLPKLSFEFLLALVEQSPNVVSHDELVERVWPGRVVSPETVTQRVKLVRNAIGDDAHAPRYIGLVRGQGYRLLVAVDKMPAEREFGRSRMYAPAALLLLVTAAVLLYQIMPGWFGDSADEVQAGANAGNPMTIAVMPFVNASGDTDDEFLSDGLADELRDQLGRISGLKVAARSSSVMFRDSPTDAVRVAERLGVQKLVEGSVRREAARIRITVQIIDGTSGFQDWTYSYDRTDGNLLALQQEIAEQVVRQVLPEISDSMIGVTRLSMNSSAYELMLLARHYFQQVQAAPVIDLQMLTRAIELYRQATAADPQSALAHSRLAAALLYLGDVEAAEEPLFRALELNDQLSEIHNTLGLFYWIQFEPGSGDEHLRAIELDPNNADALEKYGKWLWHQQITDSVEPYFLRALELDPMSLNRYLDLGHFYGISNNRNAARDIAEQIKARFQDADAMMALARIYELTGDLDEGIGWALRARELQPDDAEKSWLVAELYARIGDFETARQYEDAESAFNLLYWERRYEEMIELGEELVFDQPNQVQIWYGLARAYAATGHYEQAVHVLRRQDIPQIAYVDARRANGLEALVTLADALYEVGDIEEARRHAEWAGSKFASLRDTGSGDSWWPNLYQACTLSILEDKERALEVLQRVDNSTGLLWYPVLVDAPCFRRLSDAPEYQQVVSAYENRLQELRERLPGTLEAMLSAR